MTDQPDQPRTPTEGMLSMPDGHTLHEVELTAEQAMDVLQGRAFMFTQPDVPDVHIDEEGTLIERDDARPSS